MKRSLSHFLFFCRHVRWQVYLLLLLMLAAMALFGTVLPSKKQSLLQTQNKLVSAQSKPPVSEVNRNNEDFAHTFYEQLPTSAQLKEMQAFFFDQTVAKRLDVDTVNYQLDEQLDLPFSTYRMQVPVSGTYLEIMGFVRRLLETYPTMVLTGIALGRENAQNNRVDGDLEFSVYIKKDK